MSPGDFFGESVWGVTLAQIGIYAFAEFVDEVVAFFFHFDLIHDFVDEIEAEAALASAFNDFLKLEGLVGVDAKGVAGVFDFGVEGSVFTVDGHFDGGVIVTLMLMDHTVGTSFIDCQYNLIGIPASHM